mmetsp:Transcript_32822/g.63314  ORF Transcript_32822/g.63314 Transcript_32822/m.63314 type:complete len:934 (-) Transcript_32822:373-3174(-)
MMFLGLLFCLISDESTAVWTSTGTRGVMDVERMCGEEIQCDFRNNRSICVNGGIFLLHGSPFGRSCKRLGDIGEGGNFAVSGLDDNAKACKCDLFHCEGTDLCAAFPPSSAEPQTLGDEQELRQSVIRGVIPSTKDVLQHLRDAASPSISRYSLLENGAEVVHMSRSVSISRTTTRKATIVDDTLWHQVGCAPLEKPISEVPRTYMDEACFNTRTECSYGFPWFRKINSASITSCLRFCVSKGFDAAARLVSGGHRECRCGASKRNQALWREHGVRPFLEAPIDHPKYKECASNTGSGEFTNSGMANSTGVMEVAVYTGELHDGGIPFHLLDLTIDEIAYIHRILTGAYIVEDVHVSSPQDEAYRRETINRLSDKFLHLSSTSLDFPLSKPLGNKDYDVAASENQIFEPTYAPTQSPSESGPLFPSCYPERCAVGRQWPKARNSQCPEVMAKGLGRRPRTNNMEAMKRGSSPSLSATDTSPLQAPSDPDGPGQINDTIVNPVATDPLSSLVRRRSNQLRLDKGKIKRLDRAMMGKDGNGKNKNEEKTVPPTPSPRVWQDIAYIKYTFLDGTDDARKHAWREAASYWNAIACVQFDEVPSEGDFPNGEGVVVGNFDEDSCYVTALGHREGRSVNVNMGWCSDQSRLGNVIHEIGHVLGFAHTQQRPDATESFQGKGPHLIIHWDRIPDDWHAEYMPRYGAYVGSNTQGAADPFSGWADYDFQSIMHYGRKAPRSDEDAFDTIPADVDNVGQRNELSYGDKLKALDMYQCKMCGGDVASPVLSREQRTSEVGSSLRNETDLYGEHPDGERREKSFSCVDDMGHLSNALDRQYTRFRHKYSEWENDQRKGFLSILKGKVTSCPVVFAEGFCSIREIGVACCQTCGERNTKRLLDLESLVVAVIKKSQNARERDIREQQAFTCLRQCCGDIAALKEC